MGRGRASNDADFFLTYSLYHSKEQEGERTPPRAIKSIKSMALIRR